MKSVCPSVHAVGESENLRLKYAMQTTCIMPVSEVTKWKTVMVICSLPAS